MNIYFIIICSISILGLGVDLAQNGEVVEREKSFLTSLIAIIIKTTLIYFAIKTGF